MVKSSYYRTRQGTDAACTIDPFISPKRKERKSHGFRTKDAVTSEQTFLQPSGAHCILHRRPSWTFTSFFGGRSSWTSTSHLHLLRNFLSFPSNCSATVIKIPKFRPPHLSSSRPHKFLKRPSNLSFPLLGPGSIFLLGSSQHFRLIGSVLRSCIELG